MSINDQLLWIRDSLPLLIPELWILLAIVMLVIGSLFRKLPQPLFYGVTLGVTLVNVFLLILLWPTEPTRLLLGMLRHDDFSAFIRILLSIGTLLTLLIDTRNDRKAEYYLFLLSALLGANWLAMSMNLVMVTLSFELLSISSYVLVSGLESETLSTDKARTEAAWKYFLFGSVSTAVMIFGMSYVFGFTQTLDFASPQFVERITTSTSPLLMVGLVFTLGGFLFKLAAVPFHFWAPDVYQTAPTPIVAFFSVVPKIAGFGILVKWSTAVFAFGQAPLPVVVIVSGLAIASILVGTLGALRQTDAKRMMAYSSIAQSGFLMAALSTLTLEGVRFGLFYAAILVLMNFLTFLVVAEAEDKLQATTMTVFSGWGYRALVPSLGVLVGLISLTGLPPTAGFMAKFFVFSSIWSNFSDGGLGIQLWLFVIGLLATVLSLFFYLKVPYYLFLKKNVGGPTDKKSSTRTNLLVVILVLLLLYFFFQPGLLMGWVNKVNFVL